MRTSRQIEHSKYLKSKDWAALRFDLLELRGNCCEICGSTIGLNVHHLTYKNWQHEEPEDLIVLCRYHHMLEHGLKPKKRCIKRKNSKHLYPFNKSDYIFIGKMSIEIGYQEALVFAFSKRYSYLKKKRIKGSRRKTICKILLKAISMAQVSGENKIILRKNV